MHWFNLGDAIQGRSKLQCCTIGSSTPQQSFSAWDSQNQGRFSKGQLQRAQGPTGQFGNLLRQALLCCCLSPGAQWLQIGPGSGQRRPSGGSWCCPHPGAAARDPACSTQTPLHHSWTNPARPARNKQHECCFDSPIQPEHVTAF